MLNNSQSQNKSNKEYNRKLVKEILLVALIAVGLKVGAAALNK